jgi:hypothetical protein
MVEEDEDESPHVNMDETDEEAQDTCPAFDDDLDSEVNDFTIEDVVYFLFQYNSVTHFRL